MVKTQVSEHAKINRSRLTDAIKIFGKVLTLRVVSRTQNLYGQNEVVSTADTTFRGDLQFGLDIDQKYIETGVVEVGDGILYIHPTILSTLPNPQDQIIDGNSVWEIVSQIESPELDGFVCHYSYRCKRRINSSDV